MAETTTLGPNCSTSPSNASNASNNSLIDEETQQKILDQDQEKVLKARAFHVNEDEDGSIEAVDNSLADEQDKIAGCVQSN